MPSCLTGCFKQSANGLGNAADIVNIRYGQTTSTLTAQYVMASGMLEDKLPSNISVKWHDIWSSTDAREALVAGWVDIAILSAPSVISAINNDLPITVLSGATMQASTLYSSSKDIKSLDDINETHKIASLSIGGSVHLALKQLAKARYGDPLRFDNNMVSMQYADMFAMVKSSDTLDAIIVGFPNTIHANNSSALTPILNFGETEAAPTQSFYLVANSVFYNENPALINTFKEAFGQATSFIKKYPEEAADVIYENFYQDIALSDLQSQIKEEPPFFEISESSYDTLAQFMYESGVINSTPKKFSELPNYDAIPKTV
jgi:NitT/TauT family transport system substrate-binding protein